MRRIRAYKPKPGSPASRVVELLQFLPKGTALRSSDLCRSLGIDETCGFSQMIKAAVKHGLVRPVKVREPGALRSRRVYWIAGDGVSVAEPESAAVEAAPPAPRAVRSVFDLGAAR